ncbi:MAG: tetratricopeptide repeat protein [Betaproteobacteria bacterium]
MKTDHLRRIAGLFAAALTLALPMTSWGNLAEAEAAYEKGEYYPAFRAFVPVAKEGNPVAQAALGRIYLDGQGAPKDARAAVAWYERAAEQGHACAQFQLAKLVGSGIGAPADVARAAQWMEKSASQDVVWSMHALGQMYRDGTGLAKDNVRAYTWLELAATYPPSAITAEYIALAKTARTELERAMSADQVREAQKRAGEWRASKRPRDDQWQKTINRPASLQVAGEGGKSGNVSDQKPTESSPLTRDYFPKT